ncbi:sensor histidine kinase [Aliamphritea hakodatensis]|uniref:sensor histidine kinase n=1 Tax=Aliamphritea hakodatensis TaxID=2895352 RepID=UPI0022FD6322|nr:HAMP domain-containing sensor histidine kinase [Aliamphritea hakodatensis]
MQQTKSLKSYILFRIILLAICMSALLTYQSTQYFLEGFDSVQESQMIQASKLLPPGQNAITTDFGYHVADRWEKVPENIRNIFPTPPERHQKQLIHFENWWYFAPPEKSYSLMSLRNKHGELRYVSKIMISSNMEKTTSHEGLDPMVIIALWGLGSLAVFIFVIYRMLNNLTYPVQSIYKWARQLNLKSANESPPDFQYDELNQLAKIIHGSIQNAGQALEREKEFLGFASHELRTPIATLRSNATLLDKISTSPSLKEREVRDRILRASLTMKGITETLLWLNRDSQEALETTDVHIEYTLQQVTGELDYLLAGKDVEVSIRTQPTIMQLPEAAFRILITNIIRNAFQHTISGKIQIIQDGNSIRVINTLPASQAKTQTGFGLGLKLIRQLVSRFNWALTEQEEDASKQMTVIFNPEK